MELLFYQTSPHVTLGTVKFISVPTILQYEDTPLLEVIQQAGAGYSTRFSIYHQDGTDLARVVGARIFATAEGKKAGLTIRHPDLMTVCEMNGKPVFELRREGSAALKVAAELYARDGIFLKSSHEALPKEILRQDGTSLKIGGLTIMKGTIANTQIGIHIFQNGRMSIG